MKITYLFGAGASIGTIPPFEGLLMSNFEKHSIKTSIDEAEFLMPIEI